jgi:hypothetical protein
VQASTGPARVRAAPQRGQARAPMTSSSTPGSGAAA